MVTVAFACSSISAIGLPTMLLRPMTTACLPRRSMPVRLDQLHAAVGRAGPEAGQADHQRAGAGDVEAVDVLGRRDRLDDLAARRCARAAAAAPGCRASAGSALSASMRASSSASVSVAPDSVRASSCRPVSAQALTLLRDVDLAGRVVADQDDGQAGPDAARLERGGAPATSARIAWQRVAVDQLRCRSMRRDCASIERGRRVMASGLRRRSARRARSSAGRRPCWR